jgi:hypothetical protein
LTEGYDLVKEYDMGTKPYKFIRDWSIPAKGKCGEMLYGRNNSVVFFDFSSWTLPTTRYIYDLNTHTYKIWWESK